MSILEGRNLQLVTNQSCYVEDRDRYVVMFAISYGNDSEDDDDITSPEAALHRAVGFIIEDDSAYDNQWLVLDRMDGQIYWVEQGDAHPEIRYEFGHLKEDTSHGPKG